MLSQAPRDGDYGQHQRESEKRAQLPKVNTELTVATKGRDTYDDLDQQEKNNPQFLPVDFTPNPYTVVIGRGKMMRDNLGNKRLRVLASNFLPRYSETNEKRAKTLVVNEIIESIRSAGGCFVRKEKDGRWYLAKDQAVREKIGYVFRDLLCDKYRSSSKSKAEKRLKEQFDRTSTRLERAMRMTNSGDLDMWSKSVLSFDTNNTEGIRTDRQEEQQNGGSSEENRRSNGYSSWQNFWMQATTTTNITSAGKNLCTNDSLAKEARNQL